MTDGEVLTQIEGSQRLVDWFGLWPSFHDAEVVSIELNRTGTSTVAIHTFAMTSQVDSRAHYITEKHAIVRFILEEVIDTELLGFNHQNVISGLVIKAHKEGYEVVLGGCYGVESFIVAARLSVEIEPGIPPRSNYGTNTQNGVISA